MASIQTYLNQIKNAIYGKDVRSSIVDAIEKVNNDNEAYQSLADDATTALKQANAIVAGKVGIDDTNVGLGTTYSSKKITDTLNDSLTGLFPGGTQILRNTNVSTDYATTGLWSNGIWFRFGTAYGAVEKATITDAPNPDIAYGLNMNKTGTGGDAGIRQSNIPLPIGYEYTLSCYARASIAGTIAKLQAGETGYAWTSKEVTLTTEWVKYSYTFKTLYPTTSFIFGLATSRTGPAEFCGMKLELGNKATDWSPSPWDIENPNSEWTKLDLTSDFVAYNSSDANIPRYRKDNNTVWVKGVLSPSSESNTLGSTTATTIATLPTGYRPTSNSFSWIMHGSGINIWMFEITTAGILRASRYRAGTGYITPTTTHWLPFIVSFPLG